MIVLCFIHDCFQRNARPDLDLSKQKSQARRCCQTWQDVSEVLCQVQDGSDEGDARKAEKGSFMTCYSPAVSTPSHQVKYTSLPSREMSAMTSRISLSDMLFSRVPMPWISVLTCTCFVTKTKNGSQLTGSSASSCKPVK